ncbi:hypothetical protein EJ110_NYTH09632 [Nymphaea thermarum]|nr:hypothetical protein EJ110_NYTH09632 [Nymphaea thermarum]
MMLKSTLRLSSSIPVGPLFLDQAARMFSPGAITSGFKISGVIEFGPREENLATTGEGVTPTLVLPVVMVAKGLELERMYPRISCPFLLLTVTLRTIFLYAGHDNPNATCGHHSKTLLKHRCESLFTENDLSGNLGGTERPAQAILATPVAAGAATVN